MDLLVALKTYRMVAENRSFTATAQALGIGHTAVTRQIAALEAHFGVQLLQRSTRRLRVTEDGVRLDEHAAKVLAAAEAMEAALGSARTEASGLVRLGVSVGLGLYLAPRLPGLLAAHPQLRVELVMRDRLGDMISEQLDLMVQIGEVREMSLMARQIGKARRVLVATSGYLESHGIPATPDDLRRHACLLHGGYHPESVWELQGPDGAVRAAVDGPLVMNDTEAVHRAVLAGHGIAILAEPLVRDDLASGQLVRVLPDHATACEPIQLLYRSRRNLPPRMRVMIELLAHEGRNIAQWSNPHHLAAQAA